MQQRFGITIGSEFHPSLSQLFPYVQMIIDLSIIHDGIPPIRCAHGLVSTVAQVLYCQPVVAQPHFILLPYASIIRTAVVHSSKGIIYLLFG
jgi:hypothetical protein